MKLYHHPVSTCSQKVRLVLAEKGLDFDSQIIDLQKGEQFDPEYMKLNPSAVVPTIDDGGRVYVESTLINEYLDDAYPDVPLKPADAGERHRMRHWCKQIDALHPSCGIQTYAIGIRPGLLQRPKEEVDALIEKIPDAPRRAMRRSVVDELVGRGCVQPGGCSIVAVRATSGSPCARRIVRGAVRAQRLVSTCSGPAGV
jgi:glutathione S-transferase